jgi:RNA polymerase sigma-70 factor (ECF subfamily)
MSALAAPSLAPPVRRPEDREYESSLRRLEPARLEDHIDALYLAARALCGSRHDAEDLVQETFARVLKRPRFVRRGHELGYLLRALRNTNYSDRRAATRRPQTTELVIEVPDPASEAEFWRFCCFRG